MLKTKRRKLAAPLPKPIAALFVGDLHTGSDTGLCIPNHKLPSKEDRPYPASRRQEWLYHNWQDLTQQAQALSKTHRLFIGLGGDLVDGENHHDTTQTSGTYGDQVYMSHDLIKPLVACADDCKGVTGTEAHVGAVGENDRAVYELLKVDCRAAWELDIGPRRLWWAHHGISVGTRAWTDDSSMIMMARDIYFRCKANGQRVPDAIIAHDRHIAPLPISSKGIGVAVCPCWQLSTYWGESISPFKHVTIGALIWNVEPNAIEVKTYQEPRAISAAFSASH